MNKKLGCLVMAAVLAWSFPAFSETTGIDKQAELKKKIQQLEQQIAELQTMKLLKQSLPAKREQCMKVVGIETYCTCIVEKLPASVDYRQFVHLLLTPPKDTGYDKMSDEQKKDVDRAVVAWAKCVDYKDSKVGGFVEKVMNRDTLF